MDPSTNIIIETIGAGYIYPTPTTDNDYPNTHRRAEALVDINLQIRKGDFIALTGITGAGKSTLLYLLAGAIKPTSGQVIIDDVPFVQQDEWFQGEIGKNKIIYYDLHSVEKASKQMYTNQVGLAINNQTFLQQREQSTLNYFEELTEALQWSAYEYDNAVILCSEEPSDIQFNVFKQLHQRGITCIVATHQKEHCKYADVTYTLQDGIITCVE